MANEEMQHAHQAGAFRIDKTFEGEIFLVEIVGVVVQNIDTIVEVTYKLCGEKFGKDIIFRYDVIRCQIFKPLGESCGEER